MSARRLLSINNYYYRRGGAEVVFLEHNRIFQDAGWQVAPFSMQHPHNLQTPWQEYFVEEIEVERSYRTAEKVLRAARVIYSREARDKLRRLIDKFKPRIAHAHNIYHHISPSVLGVLNDAGIPAVMTVHDLKLACPSYKMLLHDQICERCKGGRIYNVALHRCVKNSVSISALVMIETLVHRTLGLYKDTLDRLIVPSRFYIEKLVEWGWPRDRFIHVPNFVDVKNLSIDREIGEPFVFAGRLSAEKGVEILLHAAALARLPLLIAGDGPQAEGLHVLADRLGTNVRFHGKLGKNELTSLIRSARAVVLPSLWYENAPMGLLEAYALGRPVIASRIGGLPELIREGETGATVPPGDIESLAATMTRFATAPKVQLAEMGARGRAWVEDEFSEASYLARISNLYASLPGK